jgi:hypothetical protein
VQDSTEACAGAEQRQQLLAAVLNALRDQRVGITDGADAAELVLCGTGNYGLRVTSGGALAILEGGTWSVELLDDGSVQLVLESDPQFSQNGQPIRSTLPVAISANGDVQVGIGTNTRTPIAGDCGAAIQQLLAIGG